MEKYHGEKLLVYNLSIQEYQQNLQVDTQNFCNGFTARNIGTDIVYVMGDPLAPNEFKAIGGNRGEIFSGRIDIRFAGGAGLIKNVLVTQKYYVNIPFINEL